MSGSKRINDAKKKTLFGIAVTFLVGLVVTLFTQTPWGVDETKEKTDVEK